MKIYKSFSKDLSNRDIERLSGTVNYASWERMKPYFEQVVGLKKGEIIKGISIDESGITFYLNSVK